jgi:hypothetical protein
MNANVHRKHGNTQCACSTRTLHHKNKPNGAVGRGALRPERRLVALRQSFSKEMEALCRDAYSAEIWASSHDLFMIWSIEFSHDVLQQIWWSGGGMTMPVSLQWRFALSSSLVVWMNKGGGPRITLVP